MNGGCRAGCAAGGMLTDTDNHTSCGLSDGREQDMFLQENRRDTTEMAAVQAIFAPRFVV